MTFMRSAGCAVALGMLAALYGTFAGAQGPPAAAPQPPAAPPDLSRASTITLDVKDAPLDAVIAEIAKQSGNRAIAIGPAAAPRPVTVRFDKTPYWEALDGLCRQQGLTYRADPDAGALTLVPAPAGEEKTSYAGPVVFKLTSISATGEANGPAVAGKLKCTVDFFWEDRVTPSAFRPAGIDKLVDADGVALDVPRRVDMMRVGKLRSDGGSPLVRLEVLGGAFWGSFAFVVPVPAKADALGEITGTFGLVTSAGRIELRIANALGEGEKSVEQGGYTLTVRRVERRAGSVWLDTEFTKDGAPVQVAWPGRGGWSLVDADGKAIEGRLMGGRIVTFLLAEEAPGGYTLVRVYTPDAAEGTYLFKFEQVPIPK